MFPLLLSRRLSAFICLLPVLLAVSLLSGCSGSKGLSTAGKEVLLLPFAEGSTGTYLPGKVVWHDLLTVNMRESGTFYNKLFGWHVEYGNRSAAIRNNGKLIASIIEVEQQEGKVPAVWMPSISVMDVDDTVDRVLQQGGAIVKSPIDMAERGRLALVEDVQGSHFVIVHTAGGDPEDKEVGFGDWLWDEIWSSDHQSLTNFYTSVIDYEAIPNSSEDYTILQRDGIWRAGIRRVESKTKKMLWVPVVRVADPNEVAKQAEELGGQVLLSPEQAMNKGNVALLRDSVGGLVVIQRWDPTATKGGE